MFIYSIKTSALLESLAGMFFVSPFCTSTVTLKNFSLESVFLHQTVALETQLTLPRRGGLWAGDQQAARELFAQRHLVMR